MAVGNGRNIFSVITGRERPYTVEITEHTLQMRNLPPSAEGLTVVHLSDIHAGFGELEPVYDETILRVNRLCPDYLLITGDFIDDNKLDNYRLPKLLKRFKPRFGSYVSFGNHDHRGGIEATTRLLEHSGVHILNNTSVCTEQGVWLVGVDDYYEGAPDTRAAFAGVPTEATSILLSHHPSLFDTVTDRDVIQLSGHTHGGQIALPFPTPRMVIKFHLRCNYVAGWYTKGKARMYVNRGLGVTGKPFRFRCPAEIAILKLARL